MGVVVLLGLCFPLSVGAESAVGESDALLSDGRGGAVVAVAGAIAAMDGEEEGGTDGGFFGRVFLGGGVSSGKPSLLEYDDDNKTISSLDDTPGNTTQGVPLIDLEVGYRFDTTGTWVSMNVMEELSEVESSVIGNLTLGQSLGALGEITLYMARTRGDVWEDPYLVGAERKDTKGTDLSLGLSYDEVLGTPVTLHVDFTRTRIKNDVVGEATETLARNGYSVTTGVMIPLFFGERSAVMGGVDYTRGAYKGASNSYDGYAVSLMHQLAMDGWGLATQISGGQRRYDAVHPTFGKKRDEYEWGISSEYTYEEPFGYTHTFVQVRGVVGETRGNISFFETSSTMVGVGLGYNF